MEQKVDIYQEITNRVIAALENGTVPWQQPWVSVNGIGAYNRVSRKPYSLLNQIILGQPGEWASFKQWQAAGAHVKKGEKSSLNVWWSVLTFPKKDDSGNVERDGNGSPVMVSVPKLKWNRVFHISQVEKNEGGVMEPVIQPEPLPNGVKPVELADKTLMEYLDREHIRLEEGGDRACYSPSFDRICLPGRAQFKSTAEYYSTAFHEAVHSTGHKSRLNRIEKDAHFGNTEYSKEELCAEMGSAMILHTLGVDTESSFANTAAYIKNWLRVLKGDNKFVVGAASRAEKAAKFILNIEEKRSAENA